MGAGRMTTSGQWPVYGMAKGFQEGMAAPLKGDSIRFLKT